jgi:hypothetical protein
LGQSFLLRLGFLVSLPPAPLPAGVVFLAGGVFSLPVLLLPQRLGIPIFGSDFWDPHWKQNSGSDYDSEDSGRKIFVEFRCLESQKIGIPILKFGIPNLKKFKY